jgi:hypothetical protein
MPPYEEPWTRQARALGFASEAEMLHHLYAEQFRSIRQMADMLGHSAFNVRRRLRLLRVKLRPRGGPNHLIPTGGRSPTGKRREAG